MAKFANKNLEELAHQLLLSPKHKRLSQIRGIERMLGIAEPGKTYPYDMVCFQITEYRNRRKSTKAPIPGDKLVGDLVTLAERITRRTAISVTEIDEGYRTYDELADELNVSTKTIRRWRRRGLMGFRATFRDGVARLVYLQSTVDRFVRQNKDLVDRGASFKQLTSAEKDRIIDMARTLLGSRRVKLHVVARQIAEKTGRAVETIRYTLRRYDQAHPERALFAGPGLAVASEAQRAVWKAYQRGESIDVIALASDQHVDDVAGVVREMTARQLKAEPVQYMHNELFDAPNADALILDAPRPPADPNAPKVRPPRDLPSYLRSLYDLPLMSAEQELDAFRRYNYLKFRTAKLIEALDPEDVRQRDLDAIAELIAQYEVVRQEIVKANLRLVVSIAKKHVGWSPRFFEIISDGNMSLLRAVEKFDYSRGFKFSTYASWAIMKNYARTIPEEHYHFSRYVTGQDELLDSAADHRGAGGASLDEASLAEALKAGLRGLNERERSIVTSHFGLFGADKSLTLEEIGQKFGVTKERVRQIERRAIGKLKSVLSPDVADLLPS